MPRLLLHIGTHKTGTTSIQRFCSANRSALRKLGLWYPSASIGEFPNHYAHHRIAHAIAGRDPDFDASHAAQFFERVQQKTRDDETILISAEPMYRHMITAPGDVATPGSPTRDERNARYRRYAQAVRDSIGGLDDVTVMIMLRRQDVFAESLYAEQIMSTGYNRPIETFAAERDLLLDYRDRLDVWADVFGGDDAISVRIFDPANMGVPIERYFVEWTGVEWDDSLEVGPRQNVSLSRTFVEFKRMLNDPKQSNAVNNELRRWIERTSAAHGDDVPDLGRSYLQPRDRVALLDRYEDANREVARRFLGTENPLFDTDVSAELARYTDRPRLTERGWRRVATLLLQTLAEDQDD